MSYVFTQQQNIIPGQITEFRGVFYRAEQRLRKSPCIIQCDCRMPDWANESCGCSGFCYRWANGDNIVFRQVDNPPDDANVVETRFAHTCRIQSEQLAAAQ